MGKMFLLSLALGAAFASDYPRMAIHRQIYTEQGERIDELFKHCNTLAEALVEVTVEWKNPNAGYARIGGFTLTREEGEEPNSGDEIAREIVKIARDHAAKQGAGAYRALGYVRQKKGAANRIMLNHAFPVEEEESEGSTLISSAEKRKNAQLDWTLAALSEERAARMEIHRMNVELLKTVMDVPKGLVEVLKSFPENLRGNASYYDAMIKSMEFQREDQKESREFQADEARMTRGMEALKLLASYYFNTQGGGAPSTPGKPPFVGKVHAFMGSIKPEEKAQLATILGEEAIRLLDAAADAKDDASCKAIFNKLLELWEKEGKTIESLIPQIGPILGKERFMALGDILTQFGSM